MNTWRLIFIAAAVLGLASGPAMLGAAAEAQPPLQWEDILFAFFGSLVGGLFVVGTQLLRRDPRPSWWAICLFGPASLWFTASGLSASLVALVTTGIVPHSIFFIAVGVGLLFGVLACHGIHKRRFRNAL
jgi:hypothetical protein